MQEAADFASLDLFADDGDVLAACHLCPQGAIFVPYEGPMGDHTHMTKEEAKTSGVKWTFDETFEEWVCPTCADKIAAVAAAEAAEEARIDELLSRTLAQSMRAPRHQ